MRADHILVVMNGEIIEQGSHHDLIHKKGKYHDLWSKQIFVMPEDKRPRSKSPKKRDGHLINDLSPGQDKIELAKALQTTEHEGSECPPEESTCLIQDLDNPSKSLNSSASRKDSSSAESPNTSTGVCDKEDSPCLTQEHAMSNAKGDVAGVNHKREVCTKKK
jgi:hypothetical protein